ncbi:MULTISPECIES: hypothetical protein [unclassified Streptomyces]|nr:MULTISPECIES: hypothetical protein [unclassified Streptomyces]
MTASYRNWKWATTRPGHTFWTAMFLAPSSGAVVNGVIASSVTL